MGGTREMNQNIFCSKCHRIPSQCCCSSANELANKLQELDSKLHLIELFKAVRSSRQQQAEIEALKLRELTDEEIIEIASPRFEDARYPSTALEFARAILKKAREK